MLEYVHDGLWSPAQLVASSADWGVYRVRFMTRQTEPFHRMHEHLVIGCYILKHFVLSVTAAGADKNRDAGTVQAEACDFQQLCGALVFLCTKNTFVNQLNWRLGRSYSISLKGQFRKSYLITLRVIKPVEQLLGCRAIPHLFVSSNTCD